MTAYHFAVGGGLTIPDATEAALAKDYGHDQGDALACYIGQELELGMRGTSLYPKVKVSGFDHVLVVGVDLVSRLTDYTRRSTSILFGDGAGAAVLRRTEGGARGVLYTRLCADGGGGELIHATGPWGSGPGGGSAGFIQMDGPKVYKLAVTRMGEVIEDALKACGLSVADVDMLVPHQANRRIIESVAHKLGLGGDRVFINIDRVGNTSAASIPIAYDQCRRAGRIQPNDLVVMAAFGAGLTWGSAVIRA